MAHVRRLRNPFRPFLIDRRDNLLRRLPDLLRDEANDAFCARRRHRGKCCEQQHPSISLCRPACRRLPVPADDQQEPHSHAKCKYQPDGLPAAAGDNRLFLRHSAGRCREDRQRFTRHRHVQSWECQYCIYSLVCPLFRDGAIAPTRRAGRSFDRGATGWPDSDLRSKLHVLRDGDRKSCSDLPMAAGGSRHFDMG